MIKKTLNIYFKSVGLIESYLKPIMLLYVRFWMAEIFWYSALTKISSWYSTIYLFKEEYKVPFIPPELAAYIATATELTCPVLLLFGIFTRVATIPLLMMTAVIQFTYLDMEEHAYWALLLAIILFVGPGKISIDYWLKKKNFFKLDK